MIAVKRLQSLFWVLLVALGALSAYLVSLRVATERNELMHVRTQIAIARADIRYLETEFSARANMRQLERWNAEDFRYAALPAEHYLDGERALAHLDGIEPNGPTYVARPVLAALADAGTAGEAVSGGLGQSRLDRAMPSPAAPVVPSKAIMTLAEAGNRGRASVIHGGEATRSTEIARAATERVALLEARLLDDHTLGDIGRRAAVEIRGLR